MKHDVIPNATKINHILNKYLNQSHANHAHAIDQ